MPQLFKASEVTENFFTDSVSAEKRGKCFSISDVFGTRAKKAYCKDSQIHDANFAFLSTALAKLHTKLYEPKSFVTYAKDIPVDVGGGFVDYVTYYDVDWAGIMNEFRNVFGNDANYIPRVNAGLNQRTVKVYTFEVAYDLRFVELEKIQKLTLQKSLQDIYSNIIIAGWDLFVQKVAYQGIKGSAGLFNHSNVSTATIDNENTTGKGFEGLSDTTVVSFFNGIFNYYLMNSNMNVTIMPNVILVPSFVGTDLISRFNTLYTNTLRQFLLEHNLGVAEDPNLKLRIESRPALDTLGAAGKGRIVAYRMDKDYVRIDMPYPMQHYITLPNIDKMSYTSAFVGQVSEIQLPYNTSSAELGVVSYWDFTH